MLFSVKDFRISNDRTAPTQTAVPVIFFIVVHAVRNLCVTMRPADSDGCGCFYVPLCWPDFGFEANTVVGYVAAERFKMPAWRISSLAGVHLTTTRRLLNP